MEVMAYVYSGGALCRTASVKVVVSSVQGDVAVLQFCMDDWKAEHEFTLHGIGRAEQHGLMVGSFSGAGEAIELRGDVCRTLFAHFQLREQITASRREAKRGEACVKRRGSRRVRVPEGKATQQRGCAVV